MGVYSADKLIGEARRLAAEYRRVMGKPLPGISGEIAEHDVMRLLGFKPKTEEAGGYDLIDPARNNKRIQIKSRTIFDESKSGQRIGQLKLEQPWDSVLLVLMDEEYQPYEIYEAERADIVEHAGRASSNRSKRGLMSVARFKIISRLVWTREDGAEPEVWENQGE